MQQSAKAIITLEGIREAAEIFGRHDENLVQIEKLLDIKVVARGDKLVITGSSDSVREAEQVIEQLKEFSNSGNHITLHDINYALKAVRSGSGDRLVDLAKDIVVVTARGKQIKPKTQGQKQYADTIRKNDVVFGIGPAGTGKTYLAVALAITALRNKTVSRLVLTRPAVEAGEKLGFLPGDLQEKVDPYLRPLYDSLYDVLGVETTQKYLERNIIEIAPLAYMRGRTLDDSFIILDEAQNTTPEQMKMFLTRLGFGSKAVITGDITQVDLPHGQKSGLIDAHRKLVDIKGLNFYQMTGADIVRHPLVYEIIKAYDLAEQPKTNRE
ncbi:MAG: PhoH family protein [Firmicutes bacterium]|nr:PhoH family protein [Bacillota bacterium]